MDAKLKKRLRAAEVAIAQALSLAPDAIFPDDVSFTCDADNRELLFVEGDPEDVQFGIARTEVVLNRQSVEQLRDWLTQWIEARDGQEE